MKAETIRMTKREVKAWGSSLALILSDEFSDLKLKEGSTVMVKVEDNPRRIIIEGDL